MKKLMILGGSRYAVPVIEAAHKLGLYVITCDYLPDNIAHKYSDEYCDVSIIDKEKTLEAAKKLHIDGIVSFACDPGVTTAAYIAEKMGLPFRGHMNLLKYYRIKDYSEISLQNMVLMFPMQRGIQIKKLHLMILISLHGL